MPFSPDRNYKFYKKIREQNGWIFWLYFIPGHSNDLASPTLVEFPDFFIVNQSETNAEFDAQLPIGQPLSDVNKLNLRLDALTGDWATVREWILNEVSSVTKTITFLSYSKDIYIPNRWQIWSNNGSGTSATTIEVDSVQAPQTAAELQFKTNNVVEYSIEIESIYSAVMKQVNWDWFGASAGDYLVTNDLYYALYSSPVKTIRFHNQENVNINMSAIASLIASIMLQANVFYRAYTRNAAASLTNNINLNHIDFYSTNTTTLNQQPNALLTYADLDFVVGVEDIADVVQDGFISSKGSNNIFEFENAYDFMKSFSENFAFKIIISNLSGDALTVSTKLIFDETFAIASIDSADVSSDVTISRRGAKITQGIAHVRDIPDLNNDEISLRATGLNNEDAYEFKTVFHNCVPIPAKDDSVGALSSVDLIFRGIYEGTQLINDKVNIRLDSTTTISTETTSSDMNWWDSSEIDPNLIWARLLTAIRERQSKSGLPYALAKLALYTFANDNQLIVECDLDITKIRPKHIGAICEYDLSSFASYLTQFSNKATLVSVTSDWVNGVSKCIFFVRGDANA